MPYWGQYIFTMAEMILCFCRSKSIIPCCKCEPLTLWTVDGHANINGNLLFLMDGDAEPFFIGIWASYFSIGTQEFCLPW